MDLSSMLRERHGKTMRSSRIKLVAMIVVLVLLAIAMFELQRWGRMSPEQQEAQKEAMGDRGPAVNTKEVSTLTDLEKPDIVVLTPSKEPPKLAVAPDVVEKKFPFITDPKTLAAVQDQTADTEPGPFFYMLYRVFQDDPAKVKAEADLKADWAPLWERAADFRGKAVRASGQVMKMWEQPVGENPMNLTRLFAYRIRADGAPVNSKGHLYDVYSIEKLRGVLRYDHVIAFGRFLKAQISEPERLDDPEFHVAVVMARALEPLTYLDEPKLPGPIVDGNRAEARPLYWLLKRARDTKPDALRAEANSKLTYLDYVNRPERYRGRPVAAVGELRRLERIQLPPDNLVGMPDVFYGQFADLDRKINTFYCIHVPEGIHLRDPVILYGYFLKKWTYTSEGGYEVQSPVFVAQSMHVVKDEGTSQAGRLYGLSVAVVVAITAAVLAVVVVVARARDRKLDDARRQREAARYAARHAQPEAKDQEAGKQ